MNTFSLFVHYFREIKKFFKGFSDYKGNQIQVYFGTPQSAFRDNASKNGKTILPMLNFHAVSWNRKPEREPVNTFFTMHERTDRTTGKTFVGRAPMVFEVNYQVSLWTNTYNERDDLMYKFYTQFIRGELSLLVPVEEAGIQDFLFMPLKIQDDFSDDTELEAGDPKETRDVIRTSFNMIGESLVPYELCEYDVVKEILIKNADPVNDTWEDMRATINNDDEITYSN